ncbi:hypothetical protein AX16_001241 [Volvariella volvacea WC 439]|nr:hypothetical protein AX16_001241 [Volvariella volvacea WC 439]
MDEIIKNQVLPKLNEDGSNWIAYQEKITTLLFASGLRPHLLGTVVEPPSPIEKDGQYYDPGDVCDDSEPDPLTDDVLEEMKQAIESYHQKEARVRLVINESVDHSMFLQLKDCIPAAKMWAKLVKVNEEKCKNAATELLDQLQNMRHEGRDGAHMRSHIDLMVALRDRLVEIGRGVSDEEFVVCIRDSLSASPYFRRLFTLIELVGSMMEVKKPVESGMLIRLIYEEADALTELQAK